MVLGALADGVSRRLETVGSSISEAMFEPVIRLGVTGLSRAGKTVFITSLVANLLNRGRMTALGAARDGRIEAAFLQPQPDDLVPRFEYETHLGALMAKEPHWPESTRSISQLRLSLRVRSGGLLGGLRGSQMVHLDIVDYPGEWLLDLGLLDKSYADWSHEVLTRLATRDVAQAYLAQAGTIDSSGLTDEAEVQSLAKAFTAYLQSARAAGFYDCAPGRFLLPGDLMGSPALTFAPLQQPEKTSRNTLWREMERRYEAYKSKIVKPFFRDHFARIDRQIVLIDALSAIHSGPHALEDLRLAMRAVLSAFNPGQTPFLSRIFGGRRVEKILFAATKADHLHHHQHPQLTAIMQALVAEARERAKFAGAQTEAIALAALRATVEESIMHEGAPLDCVRGTLLDTRRQAAFFPGTLPNDPQELLAPARERAPRWLDQDYQIMQFAPSRLRLNPGDGPPHIRLDRAAEFLLGDRL